MQVDFFSGPEVRLFEPIRLLDPVDDHVQVQSPNITGQLMRVAQAAKDDCSAEVVK